MNMGEFTADEPEELRKGAERRMKQFNLEQLQAKSPEEVQQLVHELQVHQVELEMQQEELRRSQYELQQSEEKYRKLYQFAPNGYFTLNANGGIEEANFAAAQLLGVERRWLPGKLLRRFIAPSGRADFDGFFMDLLTGKVNLYCEVALLNLRNESRTIILKGAMFDETESPYFLVTAIDITERKQAEKALLKQNQILKEAEAQAGMGNWEYDLATGAFSWSEGMYHLFGLQPGTKVTPDIYLDYVLEEDRHLAKELVRQIRKGEGPFEQTLRFRLDGKILSVKIKHIVTFNAEGKPARVLGVDMDISQVKQLEQENMELKLSQQKALLHAILDAQEQERKRISESLHNGVAQILYAAKLLLEHIDLNKTPLVVDSLKESKGKAEQLLSEAIRETRQVSHELIPLLLEEYGLEVAIQDFCQRFSHTGLQLSCHGLESRLERHLETAVYRIAQELVNNIVKHAGATRARIEVFKEGDWVVIEAQDNGKGMAEGQPNGKGIGLKTISDRVKLLEGIISIDAAPGRGTLITISLPITKIGHTPAPSVRDF